MSTMRLTAISESLSAGYGKIVNLGGGRLIAKGTGKIDFICGQCEAVMAEGRGNKYPLPLMNVLSRCGSCQVWLHLSRFSQYSKPVSMLASGLKNSATEPQFVSSRLVEETLKCKDDVRALSALLFATYSAPSKDVPKILYHYTNQGGCLGIVSSGSFWMSDVTYMNDASELTYANEIIDGALAEARKSASEGVKELLSRAGGDSIDQNDLSKGTYVMCFCTDSDLLSQWRAYGDQGRGFAIGFDASELGQPNLTLRKVRYDQDEQKTLAQSVVREVTNLFEQVQTGTNAEAQDAILPAFSSELRAHLDELRLTFKHPAFREENEWRLIAPFVRDADIGTLSFRQSTSFLVPYFAARMGDGMSAPMLPIVEVVQGPSANPQLKTKSTHTLLERFRYEHVEVRGSNTPLRV